MEASNLQDFQKELLQSLYKLREALVQDIKALGTSHAGSEESEDPKDKRIAELEAENKRLNYRISHLSRNLKEKLG